MGKITAAAAYHLQSRTGAGAADCKRALEECEGNEEQAARWCQYKGIAVSDARFRYLIKNGRDVRRMCTGACAIRQDHFAFAIPRERMVEPMLEKEGVARSCDLFFYTLDRKKYVGPFDTEKRAAERLRAVRRHGGLT